MQNKEKKKRHGYEQKKAPKTGNKFKKTGLT